MIITNTGDTSDGLSEVCSDITPRIELYLSQTDNNGVARMMKQDGIEILADGTISLVPGGLHMMFMGLADDPLEKG